MTPTLIESLEGLEGPLTEVEALAFVDLCRDLDGPLGTIEVQLSFVAPLKGDLNACLALQERLLPGWDFELNSCGPHMVGYRAVVRDDFPENGGPPIEATCLCAPTPAIALLIAIARAVMEMGDG